MNELRLFDPLSLDPLDPLDTAWRALAAPWRLVPANGAPRIRIDLSEQDGSYLVKAEIPGVRKDDIDVHIDGSLVTISVETSAEKEEKVQGRLLRKERQTGFASRSFSLACPVDEAHADAQYRDGVLALKLPKKAASTQRLKVQ